MLSPRRSRCTSKARQDDALSGVMDVGTETLVRELVLRVPGAVTVFERHHVDYCCGGALPLSEACARANVAVEAIVAALLEESAKPDAAPPPDEMLSVPMTEIRAHIVSEHHERSRRDALTLPAMARAIADRHGGSRPALFTIAKHVESLFRDLLPHLDYEERHVFPYIDALERAGQANANRPAALFASIKEPIAEMIREHEIADHDIHAIRALTNDYVPEDDAPDEVRALYAALDANERDLTRHMHLEGNVLFPRAERLEGKLPQPARRR